MKSDSNNKLTRAFFSKTQKTLKNILIGISGKVIFGFLVLFLASLVLHVPL